MIHVYVLFQYSGYGPAKQPSYIESPAQTAHRYQTRDLDNALLHSVKAGYAECTKILLGYGARPDARDSYDNTPLILACETGSYSTVKMLLDMGASVDMHGGGRGTALHKAANWGYDDCADCC